MGQRAEQGTKGAARAVGKDCTVAAKKEENTVAQMRHSHHRNQ